MVPSLMPESELVSTTTSCGPLPDAFEFAGFDSVQGPGLSAPPAPSVAVELLVSELVPPADASVLAAPPAPVPVPAPLELLDDIPAPVVVRPVVVAPVVVAAVVCEPLLPLLLEALAALACAPALLLALVVPPLVGAVVPDVDELVWFPPPPALVSFAASAAESLHPPSATDATRALQVQRDACTIVITQLLGVHGLPWLEPSRGSRQVLTKWSKESAAASPPKAQDHGLADGLLRDGVFAPQWRGEKNRPSSQNSAHTGEKKDIYREGTSMPSLPMGRGDRTSSSACSESLERLARNARLQIYRFQHSPTLPGSRRHSRRVRDSRQR